MPFREWGGDKTGENIKEKEARGMRKEKCSERIKRQQKVAGNRLKGCVWSNL
jgi:hypothetical protein